MEYNLSQSSFHGSWSTVHQQVVGPLQFHPPIRLPTQLFYVTRAISEDARRFFYSHNKFVLSDLQGSGLRWLMVMSELGMSSLRQISLRLGPGLCNELWVPGRDDTLLDPSESDQLPGDPTTPACWAFICNRLGPHLEDDQLDLRLTCRPYNPDLLEDLLNPLDSLPRLRALSIRLQLNSEHELPQSIYDAVRRKTRLFENQQGQGIFPFMDLPGELRYRVLECSELVSSCPLVNQPRKSGFIPHDCLYWKCNACFTTVNGLDSWCPATRDSFSSARPCWYRPDPWSLLNKDTLDMAKSTYYSMNVFEVWYNAHRAPFLAWSPEQSPFLRGFRPPWTLHVRHIRFVFPALEDSYPAPSYPIPSCPYGIDDNYFYPGSAEMVDWCRTIRFLLENLREAQLTLELDLLPRSRLRNGESEADISSRKALYSRIVKPLAACRSRLVDLFIHAHCPWNASRETERVRLEQSLEQNIMGGKYDSFARGKKRSPRLFPLTANVS
ncbi:hypothetical protein BDV18DRAFT_159158 [Aspergillus unguis]